MAGGRASLKLTASHLPIYKFKNPKHNAADDDAEAERPVVAGLPHKKSGDKAAGHQQIVWYFERDGDERHKREGGANGD